MRSEFLSGTSTKNKTPLQMDETALWGVARAFQTDIIIFDAITCSPDVTEFRFGNNQRTTTWIWTKWSGPGGSLRLGSIMETRPSDEEYERKTTRWKNAIFLLLVNDNHFMAVLPPNGWRQAA